MTAFGKIYTYPGNPRVYKSLIAAAYNGLTIDQVDVQIGVDTKTPEFLAKFPLGKVPTFEGADGFYLYESNAIAYYVAAAKDKSPLLGANKAEAALIQQYVALADNELNAAQAAWIYPILGYAPFSAEGLEKAKQNIKRVLAVLDSVLLKKTFLVGEVVTLADIVVACSLISFYKLVFDPSFRSAFPNVNRWFVTVINQPQVKSVVGEFVLCEKAQVYKAPAPVAAPAPKKEAKPAPAAAPEDSEVVAEKPKAKNPLDLLPKSSFVLDEWKRTYSNNDTRPVAVDWFWSNFDSEGYSIYKVDYKYNSELSMVFMSANLVGGFFQRLESARKYAFGSLVILGEDKKNVITGFFVFRGHGIPFEVTDAADFESYTFTRVDEKDKKVQEDFNAVIAWDETIYGKKFADGKIFK